MTISAQTGPRTYGNSESLQKAFWATTALIDPLVRVLFTQPLSDALGLKTYTHGTKFSNYLGIRISGADPTQGGGAHGSTHSFDLDSEDELKMLKQCRGYFFLFRDPSEIFEKEIYYIYEDSAVDFRHGSLVSICKGYDSEIYAGQNGELILEDTQKIISDYSCQISSDRRYEVIKLSAKRVIKGYRPSPLEALGVRSQLPIKHAIASSLGDRLKFDTEVSRTELIFYALAGLFTPTICVRLSPSDPLNAHLKLDLRYRYLAVKTDQPIPPHYMGLCGIIHQGINPDIMKRVKASPIKASIGIVRLIALATLIYTVNHLFTTIHFDC